VYVAMAVLLVIAGRGPLAAPALFVFSRRRG